jgi:predicted 3-demethylubiquinone-9 3-methyltransferase (glyoxalase superfamily)
MHSSPITPALWFHTDGGTIGDLLMYYKTIFGDALKVGNITPLGQTPSGNAEMCMIYLYDQPYSFMTTEKEHHPLNDSMALMLSCEGQEGVDRFWNYFTLEGKESQCGWCIDKYGLRWQILPSNFGELMSKPNAWQVMMKQTKIVIGEYGE